MLAHLKSAGSNVLLTRWKLLLYDLNSFDEVLLWCSIMQNGWGPHILSRARLIIPRHVARKREIKVFNSIRQKRAGGRISLITRPWPHYHLKMKTKTLREHLQRAIQATCCSSSHHLFSPFSLLWLQNSTSSFQRYPMDNIDFYPLYPIFLRLVSQCTGWLNCSDIITSRASCDAKNLNLWQ